MRGWEQITIEALHSVQKAEDAVRVLDNLLIAPNIRRSSRQITEYLIRADIRLHEILSEIRTNNV